MRVEIEIEMDMGNGKWARELDKLYVVYIYSHSLVIDPFECSKNHLPPRSNGNCDASL